MLFLVRLFAYVFRPIARVLQEVIAFLILVYLALGAIVILLMLVALIPIAILYNLSAKARKDMAWILSDDDDEEFVLEEDVDE